MGSASVRGSIPVLEPQTCANGVLLVALARTFDSGEESEVLLKTSTSGKFSHD
jgi:hypothetical protein